MMLRLLDSKSKKKSRRLQRLRQIQLVQGPIFPLVKLMNRRKIYMTPNMNISTNVSIVLRSLNILKTFISTCARNTQTHGNLRKMLISSRKIRANLNATFVIRNFSLTVLFVSTGGGFILQRKNFMRKLRLRQINATSVMQATHQKTLYVCTKRSIMQIQANPKPQMLKKKESPKVI